MPCALDCCDFLDGGLGLLSGGLLPGGGGGGGGASDDAAGLGGNGAPGGDGAIYIWTIG